MVHHSELKIRYDPEIGRYIKKHVYTGEIHGEGLTNIFKSIGSKLFGKTAKEMTKKAATTVATKAATTAATKTGEHLGNKAGEKIVQLLSKKQPNQQTVQPTISQLVDKPVEMPLTDYEIAERVNRIISGGKIKKKKVKFI